MWMALSQILTLLRKNTTFSRRKSAMLFSYQAIFLLPQQHSQVRTNRLSESILHQLGTPQKICAAENTVQIRIDIASHIEYICLVRLQAVSLPLENVKRAWLWAWRPRTAACGSWHHCSDVTLARLLVCFSSPPIFKEKGECSQSICCSSFIDFFKILSVLAIII